MKPAKYLQTIQASNIKKPAARRAVQGFHATRDHCGHGGQEKVQMLPELVIGCDVR